MPELHCEIDFPAQLRAQAEIVCAAALSHDGVEPLSEQAAALIWADPSATLLHAWVTDDGRLVGYGNVDARRIPTIECVVHPTARNQGSGEKLLRALLDAALRISPSDTDTSTASTDGDESLDQRPMVWSHGDLPASRHLAERLDLERSRGLLRMSCPADSLIVNLPDLATGIDIISLAEADARFGQDTIDAEMLHVNNAAFSWHPEQSGWTVDDILSHREEPWFASEECFVALVTDDTAYHRSQPQVAGFVWTKLHGVAEDTPVGTAGELYLVGVDPEIQGKRIGTVLTSLALRRLAARGVPELILYVEGDNAAALKVYERNGFTVARCDVAYRCDADDPSLLSAR